MHADFFYRKLLALVLAAQFLVVPFVATAETSSTVEAARKALPGAVSIIISKPSGNGLQLQDFESRFRKIGAGSGFVVDSRGYIVTNKHVISDAFATYTVSLADGTNHIAVVAYRDPEKDFAIIKIEGENYSAETLGNSDELVEGQQIIAIGNAFGTNPNTVTTGEISALNQTVRASDDKGDVVVLKDVIKTTAQIHPGNSGGPLVNLEGEVVGINVAMEKEKKNVSYAIPVNVIKNALNGIPDY